MTKVMVRDSIQRAGGWCEPAGRWIFPLCGAAGEEPEGGILYSTDEWPAMPAIWVATRILPSHAVVWEGRFFIIRAAGEMPALYPKKRSNWKISANF